MEVPWLSHLHLIPMLIPPDAGLINRRPKYRARPVISHITGPGGGEGCSRQRYTYSLALFKQSVSYCRLIAGGVHTVILVCVNSYT